MHSCVRGNTLAEYGLVLSLIAVVSIGGLALLGGSFSDVFNNMLGKSSSGGAAASGASGGGGPASGGAAASAPAAPMPSGSETAGSIYASIAAAPAATSAQAPAKVETAGSNGSGVTASHVQTLMDMAQKADEIGETDLANVIRDLANGGHSLAAAELAIENACSPGQSCADSQNLQYGLTDANNHFTDMKGNFESYFNSAYSNLSPELTLIHNTVEELSGEIFSMKGNYDMNGGVYTGYGGGTGSSETQQNSNEICAQQANMGACTK